MYVEISNVYVSNGDFSCLRKVKSQKKLHNSRLSAAWWTNESYLLSVLNLETEILKDFGESSLILKTNILEFYVSAYTLFKHFRVFSDLYLFFVLLV